MENVLGTRLYEDFRNHVAKLAEPILSSVKKTTYLCKVDLKAKTKDFEEAAPSFPFLDSGQVKETKPGSGVYQDKQNPDVLMVPFQTIEDSNLWNGEQLYP